uniref:Uncharacterized protein n=1 Tax=Arundo donax TaxID=35708 RepID=A0A0A9C005_ARUDO
MYCAIPFQRYSTNHQSGQLGSEEQGCWW